MCFNFSWIYVYIYPIRRKNFLNNIKNTQVILTGTEKIDLPEIEYNLYNIRKGEIV